MKQSSIYFNPNELGDVDLHLFDLPDRLICVGRRKIYLCVKYFLFLLLGSPAWAMAQEQVVVSGTIVDAGSGERLIGATVFVPEIKTGVSTNSYGFYSIRIPRGKQMLEFGYVGYNRHAFSGVIQQDTVMVVALGSSLSLDEIIVKASDSHGASLSGMNTIRLNMNEMADIPVVLGERDLLKSIQHLPGIKGGAENTAGFNVRGGSADQNLILLDGAPVYNVSHLMGFFSVFNGDAIKYAELFKGGIPSRYGGHLSSVLDVTMKDGNMKRTTGSIAVSPVSGNVSIEGPLRKDTSSYIVSFRRTFIDLPVVLSQKLARQDYLGGYNFYDLNAKTNWILNSCNRVYLSFYSGQDRYFIRGDEGKSKNIYHYRWGNITSVLRWNQILSSRLFGNYSLYYTRFNNTEQTKSEENGLEILSRNKSLLNDWTLKNDFDYYLSASQTIRFGSKWTMLSFQPQTFKLKDDESGIAYTYSPKQQAFSCETYLEDAFTLGRIRANAGVRMTAYHVNPKTYWSVEPRLSVSLAIGDGWGANASYMHNSQNLHLITNSSLGLPTDLWVASTTKVAPQIANQLTVGLTKQFSSKYSLEIDSYYKWMKKVSRFNEGTSFLNNREQNWESNVQVGDGRAYGMEFLLQKKDSRLNWSVAYTLAWSDQRFDGLNGGQWFPFKYDRRHDLSILLDYKLKSTTNTERKINLAFVFQTGNRVTVNTTEIIGAPLPGGEIDDETSGSVTRTYGSPNNFKMPSFHHLDINYSIRKMNDSGKRHEWTFGVYNLYNHFNTWVVYKEKDALKQMNLFPFMPSVSYRFVW